MTATGALDLLGVDHLLSDDEKAIQQTVRRFADERIRPHVADWYEAGEIPKAFLVLKDDGTTPEDVQEFVKERVSTYKQIRAVEVIDEIPKSASGKILRRVLRDREQAAAS